MPCAAHALNKYNAVTRDCSLTPMRRLWISLGLLVLTWTAGGTLFFMQSQSKGRLPAVLVCRLVCSFVALYDFYSAALTPCALLLRQIGASLKLSSTP